MLTDTHCHLDFPEFDADRDEVIDRARAAGLAFLVNIGSSPEGSRRSLALARQSDFVYATVGVHPHHAGETGDEELAELERLAAGNARVVGIGEVGLDYFRNPAPAAEQKNLFVRFIRLARKLKLPLVIHDREAHPEVLEILRAEACRPLAGVVHCFSADEEFAGRFLDLGLYLSFTANVTFKKADALRRVAAYVPLDRLLLETDAPYLAPQIFRGKRNEPAFVIHLAEELARLKGESRERVERITEENARKLFGLNSGGR